MAINFLNTVDLNQNQLNQAVIQNVASDPASGVVGQIIFNTTTDSLKQYVADTGGGSAGWESIGGDIQKVDGGTYITVTDPNGPIPIVNHDATTRTNTPTTSSPCYGGNIIAVKAIGTNATGHVTSVDTETYTLPADTNETYTLPVSAGAANSAKIDLTAGGTGSGIKSTVEFKGTTGRINITETVGNNGNITIDMPDDVTIVDDLTVGGVITQSQSGETNSLASKLNMNSNKITNLATGTA